VKDVTYWYIFWSKRKYSTDKYTKWCNN